MTAPVRSVLLTPNLLGADGVSCLSRQIAPVLPEPAIVLSLHDDPAHPNDASTPRHSAGGRRLRFIALAFRLLLKCDRDTIIVCTHVHLAPVARLMAWRGARVTYVLCGIESWVPLRIAERWALGGGRLVAISRHTARRFKEANPEFAGATVDVCHPGLPAWPDTSSAGETAALIVGRLAADEGYKGHELLLDAWPRVLEHHPDARLWIVGHGDDRPRLESVAARLGLRHAVTFTGRVSDQELDALYRRCRFFVMPSLHEGFGLVFLEAMRAGKACIGAAGAASEIIEHGITGLIVDGARLDDVCGAVVRLFDEPDTCARFGRAGAARFRAEFTDTRFRARFAAVIPTADVAPPLPAADRCA
jgi:glycosyltransferase involved in cell wall biosynthesis